MSHRGWIITIIVLVNLVLLVDSGDTEEQQQAKHPMTITSDRLEVNRKLHTAVYSGNVMADDKNKGLVILSDKMEFLFDEEMEQIEKGLATGNVRLTVGEKKVTADRLEWFPGEDRAVLTGNPRVWQDNDLITGSTLIIFLKEDRAIVEGGPSKRVTAILYPRPERVEQSKSEAPGKAGQPVVPKEGF